ncbi:MAG: hypothetical protein WC358_07450 [Ignavibacteria bacterium]|jgi:hypothetical protein
MSEAMNSNLKMGGYVDAELFGGSNTPKLQRELIDVNKEYMYALTDGYIKAVDAMIQYLNGVEVDKTVKNKVMLVLTSLVFNEDDIDFLKDSKLTTETGTAIPTLTELQYINDIPLDFDIVQSVYLYILRIAKEAGFYSQNGVFGNLDISGVMFNNARNLTDVYKSYVVGIDGEIEDIPSKKIAQKITDLCRANSIVRERLIKLAGGGKRLSKKEEFYIRRHYKYNPETGSLEKRNKPISSLVFALLANKNDAVFSELKKLLK